MIHVLDQLVGIAPEVQLGSVTLMGLTAGMLRVGIDNE